MKLRPWLWTLAAVLGLLAAGHATANGFGSTFIQTHFPDILADQSHTTASLWVRLASMPARLVLVIGLLSYLAWDRTSFRESNAFVTTLLPIASLLIAFYSLDLLLDSTQPLSTPTRWVLAGATVSAAILCPFLASHRLRYTVIPVALHLLVLSICLHRSEAVSGSNNAFTIFAAQAIALLGISIWQRQTDSFLRFAQLAPALGYLFPITEKLLLNPIGWLSGTTWQAWAAYYGYNLNLPTSLALTYPFLLFQGGMIAVLFRPRSALWLYPIGIGFHLISGLILGFGAALNPWIVSLIIGWILSTAVPTHNPSTLSTV